MSHPATLFVCTRCDAQSPKWLGQCAECGAWGTVEAARPDYAAGAASARRGAKSGTSAPPAKLTPLDAVTADSGRRLKTGIGELDRVFGGGIVPGSVILLGGEPGIGKSTLALLLCSRLVNVVKHQVAYVSGEESAGQIKMRVDRLKLSAQDILFAAETEIGSVIASLEKHPPALAVIDSVQTIFDADIPSEAGALNQVRGATARLTAFAKRSGVPILLIGHVTKDGHVAGPKTLEHLVDAVLSFEGERSGRLRVLRTLKNRFGSTDETGIFDMADDGLHEISNPSAYLLEERRPGVPGSAVSCIMEGTRPVLVEIQALVQKTSFGYPTRRATGLDPARLEMLVAVLAKRASIDLSQHDAFVNVVGGLKVKEPAVDLAVLAALASAFRGQPVTEGTAVWGEVGLGGEVRSVAAADRRLAEAAALGLKRVITSLPRSAKLKSPAGVTFTRITTVREALDAAVGLSGAGMAD